MSTDFFVKFGDIVYGITLIKYNKIRKDVFMGKTFEIGESIYEQIKDFPYDELVKILAILTIVEEEGLTPAVWEKWGAGKNKREYLRFEVSRDYKEGVPNGTIPEEIIHYVKYYVS